MDKKQECGLQWKTLCLSSTSFSAYSYFPPTVQVPATTTKYLWFTLENPVILLVFFLPPCSLHAFCFEHFSYCT